MKNQQARNRAHLYLPVLLACALFHPAALGNVIYDEDVAGDLSNLYFAPTELTLAPGSNIVRMNLDVLDNDLFSFTLPSGLFISTITVVEFEEVIGDFTLVAADEGGVMGASANDWLFFSQINAPGTMLGDDILSGGPFSPLEAGTYTFLSGEVSEGRSRLALDFQVVPAPSSLALLAVGLILSLRSRQHRRLSA